MRLRDADSFLLFRNRSSLLRELWLDRWHHRFHEQPLKYSHRQGSQHFGDGTWPSKTGRSIKEQFHVVFHAVSNENCDRNHFLET